MDKLTLINLFQHTLWLIMLTVCILTIPTLIVGMVISILQAATQINEMSLTFIPKLIVMFLLLVLLLPWLMHRLVVLTQNMLLQLPNYLM